MTQSVKLLLIKLCLFASIALWVWFLTSLSRNDFATMHAMLHTWVWIDD